MKNLLSVLCLIVMASCSVVSPGERGVRISMGQAQQGSLESGYYLWVPFFRSVKTISVRVQKTEAKTEAASKDMQKVEATVAVNWHLSGEDLHKTYTTLGDEEQIVERVINPAVSEVLKAATAKMTAEEILTRRIELKKSIDEGLVARLKSYGITLDDVSLVDLSFTKEFNHAVESKQIAEQQAKQAEYVALKATQDAKAQVNAAKGSAEAQVINAKAQAEAQNLMKTSITPAILQQKALEKWDGVLPQIMGSGSMPFINLKLNGKSKE